MILKLIYTINRIISKLFSIFFERSQHQGKFLNKEESLNLLVNTNKSLIRWGDGESTILTGGNLYFQNNSFKLVKKFHLFVRKYSNKSNYLIAIPTEYLKKSKNNLSLDNKYKMWLYTRFVYWLYFKKIDVTYLDSFIFRENTSLKNTAIEKLWINKKHVFFVHSNFKYFFDFKEKYKSLFKTYFIQIPSANAFNYSTNVINKLLKIIKDKELLQNEICILISAGPAGKIIVVEMSNKGFQALDMGHYFDYKFYELRRDDK
jgi:hypothetical protein